MSDHYDDAREVYDALDAVHYCDTRAAEWEALAAAHVAATRYGWSSPLNTWESKHAWVLARTPLDQIPEWETAARAAESAACCCAVASALRRKSL